MLSSVGEVCFLMLLSGCAEGTARVEVNPDIHSFPVHTVAILPFEGVPFDKEVEEYYGWWRSNIRNNGDVISDMLATELIGVGDFNYLERSQVRRILAEKDLTISGLIREKSASEIGKLLGADAVVLGTVGKLDWAVNVVNMRGCNLSFSSRMVHTETGVILWSATVTRQEGHCDVLAVARQECAHIAKKLKEALRPKSDKHPSERS